MFWNRPHEGINVVGCLSAWFGFAFSFYIMAFRKPKLLFSLSDLSSLFLVWSFFFCYFSVIDYIFAFSLSLVCYFPCTCHNVKFTFSLYVWLFVEF